MFCIGFGCAYFCWAAFETPVEHLVNHQLHVHAAQLKLSWPLPARQLRNVHYAAFAIYEAAICLIVTRLLWYALRGLDAFFSASLLLAMYISGSIFSSAAIVYLGLGGHF